MPYVFVRCPMNEGNAAYVLGTTTHVDFHLAVHQNDSQLYRTLMNALPSLTSVNDTSYGTPGRKMYYTHAAAAYEVLNALETCGYKVVAARSIPIGTLTQYMWTLQGSLL